MVAITYLALFDDIVECADDLLLNIRKLFVYDKVTKTT